MTAGPRLRVDPAAVLYLVLAVVAAVQWATGRASADDVAVFALPAVLLAAADLWRRASGERWIRAIAVVGALLAVWAVVAFALALPHAEGPDGFYDVKVRVVTAVADHNVLASLLLVGLVAGALLRGRVRWLAVGAVTLGLGATLSRGAALVAVVAAGGAWILAVTARRTGSVTVPGREREPAITHPRGGGAGAGDGPAAGAAAWLTGGALGALALVLLAAAVLGASVPEGGGPASVASRGQLWRAGVAAITAEPLVGVGLDGFRDVAAAEGAADPRDHAHSLLLHAAATVGIPAALLYLALWGLLAVRGLRHPDGSVRMLVVVGGGALFLHGLIDETAFRLPVELTLAALLAVSGPGWEAGRDAPRR